jgi:hypothetical protein
VTFARLTRGDWVAAIAALALLLVMAMDWYTTDAGVVARDAEQRIHPKGALAGEVDRAVKEDARIAADKAEQNAWQADPFPDRVILFALLATIVLAVGAAWLRAAGKRFEPPWTPSVLACLAALFTALMLTARIIQKPSADIGSVIKLGAPLGLACLGAVAVGARAAWMNERDGTVWDDDGGPGRKADPFADTDETEALGRKKPPPLFDHAPAPAGAETPAATALIEPQTVEHEEAWAPDWSDPAAPPNPEPEPEADRSRRRRRRGRTAGRNRRRRT